MTGLCAGGNEPPGSLKAICNGLQPAAEKEKKKKKRRWRWRWRRRRRRRRRGPAPAQRADSACAAPPRIRPTNGPRRGGAARLPIGREVPARKMDGAAAAAPHGPLLPRIDC
ncbi:hypothetical protein ANN_01247, partial [Periplaneta americana]